MTYLSSSASFRAASPVLRSLRIDLRPAVFLGPLVVLMGVFVYWPVVATIYLAFFKIGAGGISKFVGVDNFVAVFSNLQFYDAVINTFIYILVSLPLKTLLPIPLAIFLWATGRRVGDIYKSVLFVPTLLSFLVVSVVWIWILNPVAGLLQSVIRPFGLQLSPLLSDASTAIYVIVGVSTWKVLGYNVLLYLAGLSSIGADYIEAMRMDGAGDWTIVRRLIVPLLSPTIYFVAVSTAIFTTQQVVTPIDAMTQGGPLNATTNVFYVVYQFMFQSFNVGYAAAGAVVVIAVVGVAAAIQMVWFGRRVHYS